MPQALELVELDARAGLAESLPWSYFTAASL
jgi:hypothetical protein